MAKKATKPKTEFLENISVDELVAMKSSEKDYKTRTKLQAAILRKKGKTVEEISDSIGVPTSTVDSWLIKLNDDIGNRYDKKIPGRPCRLSDAQKKELCEDLDKKPSDFNLFGSVWTGRLVARHILNKFNVKYTDSGALKLTARLNFSVRTTRSVPYNSATKEEQEKYMAETAEAVKSHDQKKFKIVFMDASAMVDSPTSKRGIRRKGVRDEIKTNHSKKSIKILGALGVGTLDIQFHPKADSESALAILEYMRRKYGKIFVILDNAAAHTSKAVKEYIDRMKGDVVLWFLPPYTPQQNSIETMWREIKRAISGEFFGSFDKLQDYVRGILRSKSVPIVKLFAYILDVVQNQKGPWDRPRLIPIDMSKCTCNRARCVR